VIGALNLLSEHSGAFTSQDESAAAAVCLRTLRSPSRTRGLFRSERHYARRLRTLAEIGREMSSILDLDVLLTRIASLTKRLIDYRTFGILLLNETTNSLEMKLRCATG
jgi:sigma-B regulation protein RsbU (phosphoserine phosphatase)